MVRSGLSQHPRRRGEDPTPRADPVPRADGRFLSLLLTESDSSEASPGFFAFKNLPPVLCHLHQCKLHSSSAAWATFPRRVAAAPLAYVEAYHWLDIADRLRLGTGGRAPPLVRPSPAVAGCPRAPSARCLAVCLFLIRPPACAHGHRRDRGALPFPRSSTKERDRGVLLPVPLPGV